MQKDSCHVSNTKLNRIFATVISLLFMPALVSAVTFGRHYEINSHFVTYAAPSKDNGYLIALTDGTIPVVQKISAAGKTLWTASYEDELRAAGQIHKILELSDGGMLIVGTERKNRKTFPMFLRTNEFAEPIWYKVVDSEKDQFLFDAAAADGGYILAGCTESFSAKQYCDGWLMKIDESGNELWSKRFAGKFDDAFYRIIPTRDGFVVSGTVDAKANVFSKGVLLKIDSQGNILWKKTYKNPNGHLRIWSVVANSDGSLISTGTYFHNASSQSDLLIMKLSASGDLKWKKSFSGTDTLNSEEGFSIAKSKSSGFVVAGETRVPGSFYQSDGILLKVDDNGKFVWGRKFGNELEDLFFQIESAADGGYMLVAIQNLAIALQDYYFAILKVNPSGVIPGCDLFKTVKLPTIEAAISIASVSLPSKTMRANPRSIYGQNSIAIVRQRKLCQ